MKTLTYVSRPLLDREISTDVCHISVPVTINGMINSNQGNLIRCAIKAKMQELGSDIENIPYKLNGMGGKLNKHDESIPKGLLGDLRSSMDIRCRIQDLPLFTKLSNQVLTIGQQVVTLGNLSYGSLRPYPDIYCYCLTVNNITSEGDMYKFIQSRLEGMNATITIGKRRIIKIRDGLKIVGFSVLLQDLAPEHSILIQSILDGSFGGKGHYGCSFFK